MYSLFIGVFLLVQGTKEEIQAYILFNEDWSDDIYCEEDPNLIEETYKELFV